MTKTLAAAALAAGLLAGGAQAGIVVQTVDFTNITSTSLVFDGFDTALGTFTGATLSVSGNATLPAGSVTGRAQFIAVDAVFDVLVEAEFFLSNPFALDRTFVQAFCITASDGEECTATYDEAVRAISLSESFNDPSRFIGSEPTFDFRAVTSLQGLLGNPVGNATTFWTATGTATLTYTYDPVTQPDPGVIPLPGSLQLALGGLALLGGVAYRRRSRA